MINKKALSFDLCVTGVVIAAHIALFFAINQHKSNPLTHPEMHSIINIDMVQLQEPEPAIPPEVKKISDQNPHTPDRPQKNAPRTSQPDKKFTAPTKAPVDQLAAKAHEPVQKDQKPTVAKTQEMQTTKTDSTKGSSFSATSLAGGDANKTTGTGKDATGTSTQTGARNVGKQTTGGDGGGVNQRASIIQSSINKNYNENLKNQGIHGTVNLRVTITASGRAKAVEILNSPSPALNMPAKRAAMGARYKPEIKGGEKVESVIAVNIVYRLTD